MQQNFTENPSQQIENVFQAIHENQMTDLPFVNENLKVSAVDFSLYEGDWLGVLLTPWTLNIMLLPGPDREWRSFKTSEKIGIRLPAGDYNFIHGEHEDLGHYFSCSVQSPVTDIHNQEEAIQIAKDIRQLITAIPVKEIQDKSKRGIFSKLASGQPLVENTSIESN